MDHPRLLFTLFVVGLLINSALYCAGVFVAGIVTGNLVAAYLAIATVGVCYLSYLWQVTTAPPWRWHYPVARGLIGSSILSGLLAGGTLLGLR